MKHFMKHLSSNRNRICLLYTVAILLFFVAMGSGLLFGSTSLSPSALLEALLGGNDGSVEARIFWYVRFPRTCACLLCGAALATSGAVIQGVLANPLASPGIVGVNSGAGLAVTLCASVGILGGWRLTLFSFLGAFTTVLLVSLGARKWGASRGTVILMGVALNSLLNAFSDTVITLDPDVGMMSNDFKIGDFSTVTYLKLIPAAVVILLGLLVLFTLSNELEILSLGEENAKGLGLNTAMMTVVFLLLSALLAGAAVSIAGLLSFVGLLVPHAVRRLSPQGTKHLLPLSALLGAGFVTLCDTLARVLFSPYEIPVGIIMAFLGAPFFLFLLIRGKGGHAHD